MQTDTVPMPELPAYLTVKAAARILQLSPRTIYEYITQGHGPKVVRCGRVIRINRDSFLEWAEQDHPKVHLTQAEKKQRNR